MFSIVTQSQRALDGNYDRVRCLSHVGTEGGSKTAFFITAAEVRKWQDKKAPSEVAVVTSALHKPAITMFTRDDVKRFILDEVLLRARLK